ncbi:hypothetical protein VPHK567_0370 [Vibrio phage K567]
MINAKDFKTVHECLFMHDEPASLGGFFCLCRLENAVC